MNASVATANEESPPLDRCADAVADCGRFLEGLGHPEAARAMFEIEQDVRARRVSPQTKAFLEGYSNHFSGRDSSVCSAIQDLLCRNT